jgi:hypothetical protein
VIIKTEAQQRLEYLQGLRRELTEQESEDLRRALHATYEYDRRRQRRLTEIAA